MYLCRNFSFKPYIYTFLDGAIFNSQIGLIHIEDFLTFHVFKSRCSNDLFFF